MTRLHSIPSLLAPDRCLDKRIASSDVRSMTRQEQRDYDRGAPASGAIDDDLVILSQDGDGQLMMRARDGNERAFEFMVSRYRDSIVQFMYRLTPNQQAFEELAQEVFLRAYRCRGTYRAQDDFSTWIYRIAVHIARNHITGTENHLLSSKVNLVPPEVIARRAQNVVIAESLLGATPSDEVPVAVVDQVRSLSQLEQIAIVLHKYQKMEIRQIGRVLKLSDESARSLLFGAYQNLREHLRNFVSST